MQEAGCCFGGAALPRHSQDRLQAGRRQRPAPGLGFRGQRTRVVVWVTLRRQGVVAESGEAASRQKGCDPCSAGVGCQAGGADHAFLPASPHPLWKEPRWLPQILVSVPCPDGCCGLPSACRVTHHPTVTHHRGLGR